MTRTLPCSPLWLLLLAVAACGDDETPRYGEVPISPASPRAVLTGRTNPTTAALELSPGCAGFVDPETPEHLIRVWERGKMGLTARSTEGPLAILVESEVGTFCDSDQNTGHAPHVQIVEPGLYAVRVASLTSQVPLAYELVVGPDGKEEHGGATMGSGVVNVSVTSTPPGATVRTPGGQVLGTAPAIFGLPDARPGDGQQHNFVVELPGYVPVTLTGTATGEEMVMHANLVPAGPRTLTVSANDPQPIRDFSTATQSVEVEGDCTIDDLEVDVAIQHSYVGDLFVQLRSPSGTVATLHRFRGGARSNLERTFRLSDGRTLRGFASQQARGTWEMTVRDSAELDVGTFQSFSMRITCAAHSAAAAPAGGSGDRTARAGAGSAGPGARGRRAVRRAYGRGRRAPPQAQVLDPWGL